jgi:uncharacterized protein
MSSYRNIPAIPGSYDLATSSAAQQGFFTRVYGWMGGGLALTALIASFVASSPILMQAVVTNRALLWGLIITELVIVFGLSAMVNRISATVATMAFLFYAALNGVTLSVIFLVFTRTSLASTFLVTAGMFGAMAAFGATTKRDLTGVGSFMFMGLIGLVIAGFVNIWLHSPMVTWVSSVIGVFVFVGLTAFDAQQIKYMAANAGSISNEDARRASVMGALRLYLDFVNMFLYLLQLFGGRNRD